MGTSCSEAGIHGFLEEGKEGGREEPKRLKYGKSDGLNPAQP